MVESSNVELAFLFSLGRVTNKVWFYTSIGRAAVNLMTLCLRTLQNIGYNIPTYSTMRIVALNVGLHHDIGLFCAKLAEGNMNDVVNLITYIQINCYVYIYAWFSQPHFFPTEAD